MLSKPITQLEACKLLTSAAAYVASGLGFEVQVIYKNELPLVGNQGTIEEGLRDVVKALGVISTGAHIDARKILAVKPPETPKLIVPGT